MITLDTIRKPVTAELEAFDEFVERLQFRSHGFADRIECNHKAYSVRGNGRNTARSEVRFGKSSAHRVAAYLWQR